MLFNSSLVLAILLLEVDLEAFHYPLVLCYVSWLLICSTSFPIAARELANSRSATAEKIGIAKPPFFTGKESRSRSSSKHMWLSVIAGINTLSTIASKSHVLLEVTDCSYCNTSVCVWIRSPTLHKLLVVLYLQSCTGISIGRTTNLPIPQRISTRILSPICSHVNTSCSKDFSCFLLSCWLYDQPRLWSVWVTPQLRTFLDLFN